MTQFHFVRSSFVVAALFAAGVASAQETNAPIRSTLKPIVLSCPSGSVQKGGPGTAMEVTACMKSGTQTFHGPYVYQWRNGNTRAIGQTADGFRTGRWVFFNEDGSKEAEIDFTRGDYDGKKVEFHSNGRVKLEETWVKGKRQGLVRQFDAMGDVVAVKEYRDDRAVASR